MTSSEYWAKREAEALKQRITDEKEYDKQVKRIYQDMLDGIQSQIDGFYGKYADKEGITLAEAKKRVSKLDIAAYERKAAKYVKEKNFSAKANEEMRLYNATMKINRLEMLKANIGTELIAGHDELEKFMGDILQGRTMDELKRQAGILGKTVKNNAQKAHAIVNSSFHNAKFSDRIWMYQDLLKSDLSKLLQSGLIQGKNPRELARELKKTFNTSTYNAERLMRTELARVQTEAQKQSFERNGFEDYEFIVNGGCCPICQALSGKHFKVEKMMPGENAPPMHPHCRCSVAAWSDRKEYDEWLDFLDKGGTTEEYNRQRLQKIVAAAQQATGKYSKADQVKAIEYWSDGGYGKIRRTQTGKSTDPTATAQGEAIEEFIDQAKTYKGDLYRGISTDEPLDLRVGQVIDMKGTSSWSKSEDAADEFAHFDEYSYFFVTEGLTRAADISMHAMNPGEEEVLVSAKTKFKVLRIEYDPDLEQTVVVVEEINPKVNNSSTSKAKKSSIIDDIKELSAESDDFLDENNQAKYKPEDIIKEVSTALEKGTYRALAALNKYTSKDTFATFNSEKSQHEGGKVYINAAKALKSPKGFARTCFHELGHNIDYEARGQSKRLSLSSSKFGALIRSDAAAYIEKFKKKNGDLDAFAKISKEIGYKTDRAYATKHHAISDIFDGVTNGQIKGRYTHSQEPGYWQGAGALEKETFAHMFQAQFNPEDYALLQKYFPNALKEFERLLERITEEL